MMHVCGLGARPIGSSQIRRGQCSHYFTILCILLINRSDLLDRLLEVSQRSALDGRINQTDWLRKDVSRGFGVELENNSKAGQTGNQKLHEIVQTMGETSQFERIADINKS